MLSQVRWSFSLTHIGRGGFLLCSCPDATARFEIELVAGDAFVVHVKGKGLQRAGYKARALRPPERQELIAQLRTWLDTSERRRWSIASGTRQSVG